MNTASSGTNRNISRVFNVTTVPLENYALEGLSWGENQRSAILPEHKTQTQSIYGNPGDYWLKELKVDVFCYYDTWHKVTRRFAQNRQSATNVRELTDNGHKEIKRRNRAATSRTDVTGVWHSADPQAWPIWSFCGGVTNCLLQQLKTLPEICLDISEYGTWNCSVPNHTHGATLDGKACVSHICQVMLIGWRCGYDIIQVTMSLQTNKVKKKSRQTNWLVTQQIGPT